MRWPWQWFRREPCEVHSYGLEKRLALAPRTSLAPAWTRRYPHTRHFLVWFDQSICQRCGHRPFAVVRKVAAANALEYAGYIHSRRYQRAGWLDLGKQPKDHPSPRLSR